MAVQERNRVDDVFDALSNRHRRRVLVELLRHNPQTDVLEVTDESLLPGESPDALALESYHVHLPKLEEMGFVEWNRETHTVVAGSAFEDVRNLLELIDAHSDELPAGW